MRRLRLRTATVWQLGLIVLTGLTAGLFLIRAFAGRFIIQDDARQLATWRRVVYYEARATNTTRYDFMRRES